MGPWVILATMSTSKSWATSASPRSTISRWVVPFGTCLKITFAKWGFLPQYPAFRSRTASTFFVNATSL